jgi:ferredoxin
LNTKIVFKRKPLVTIHIKASFDQKINYQLTVPEGTILLDAINQAEVKNISVFGVCDKQLACHSCAVDISRYTNLEKPTVEEEDVLSELGNKYRENKTRMSCQIVLKKEFHDDMEVEIHETAFLFNDEDNI